MFAARQTKAALLTCKRKSIFKISFRTETINFRAKSILCKVSSLGKDF